MKKNSIRPKRDASVSPSKPRLFTSAQIKPVDLHACNNLLKTIASFDGDLSELHQMYNEVSDQAINSLKRAKGGRKKQYEKLLEIITHEYLDKIVTSEPEELSEQTKKTLEGSKAKLDKLKSEILEECTQKILEILKEKQER